MHIYIFQQELREAQRKEHNLNAELRQYRDDLEATKVLYTYTVTLYTLCVTVTHYRISTYDNCVIIL